MPKREATSELTDRNWDREEEPEEAGTFQKADIEDIEKRVIKKARRRGAADGSQGTTASAFGGFKGFSGLGSTSTTSRPGSTFTGSLKPNGGDNNSSSTASFSFVPKSKSSMATPLGSINPETKPSSNGNHAANYSTQLQSLNKCVLEWIQKHIYQNPVCDLSPIFDDYKKHLSDIEKDTKVKEKSKLPSFGGSVASQKTSEPPKTQPAFSGFEFKTNAPSESKPAGFQLGSSTGSSSGLFSQSASSKPPESSQPPSSGFSFTAQTKAEVKPFSFGGTAPQKTEAKPFGFGASATAKDEEEYEPPKAEVKEVKENDAMFTIRCKLFYKSGDVFKDKGVGNLHLKKTDTVTQLLVRADTNLGNVILNVGLPPNLPLQRQGKNNVMMIIPPNPPVSNVCPQCNKKYPNPQTSNMCESGCVAKPVPLLFRVKTSEDADKLLAEIKSIL